MLGLLLAGAMSAVQPAEGSEFFSRAIDYLSPQVRLRAVVAVVPAGFVERYDLGSPIGFGVQLTAREAALLPVAVKAAGGDIVSRPSVLVAHGRTGTAAVGQPAAPGAADELTTGVRTAFTPRLASPSRTGNNPYLWIDVKSEYVVAGRITSRVKSQILARDREPVVVCHPPAADGTRVIVVVTARVYSSDEKDVAHRDDIADMARAVTAK